MASILCVIWAPKFLPKLPRVRDFVDLAAVEQGQQAAMIMMPGIAMLAGGSRRCRR
jgi:hypothetical protein